MDINQILIKWAVIVVFMVLAFCTGLVKGCEHASADYKQAETIFLTKTKELVKVEVKEVIKYKTQIQTVDHIVTQLIEAAHAETPNQSVCDLSTSRVQRINEAISSYSSNTKTGVPPT